MLISYWSSDVCSSDLTHEPHGMADQRQFFCALADLGLDNPVIIRLHYPATDFAGPQGNLMDPEEPLSKLQLYAATDMGGLLVDGMGSGIWIDSPATPTDSLVSAS